MAKAQILIAEDNVIIAMDIESRLKQLGYDVAGIVGYGEQVIEKVKENTPDLVLMEIVLKGEIDGIDTAKEIRDQFDIPVVFLAAFADKERLKRAKLAYPFGFILKPFQNKDLEVTIEMALSIAKANAERKQAEEALRESEEKYSLLANKIPSIVYKGYKDWSVDFFGEKIEQLTGYSANEFNSKRIKWIDIIVKEDIESARRSFIQALKTDKSYVRKYRIKSKTGDILWIDDRGQIICDSNGEIEYASGTFFDITKTKKFEAQLQQSQKLLSLGTLAGGIAHDLNNLLFPIFGFVDMMLQDTLEDSPYQRPLNEVLTAAKRARDLVKQILTFSRQADQELKPVQVQLVLKEVLKLSSSMLPSTIDIKQNIGNDCGFVMADPTQLHQIVMNLVTNAYHAMQDAGGELEVSLKEVDLDVGDLQDPAMIPGRYICLTVADTGIGIEQPVLNQIFDPYFTTKEKDKGTGLGLSVVHGIVKGYRGDIRVYSEPGKGTVFHVYLPKTITEVEAKETEDIKPIQKGTEQILIVDDEDSTVRMEKQMLEQLGYHVTARTSSIEALEAFRAAPDKFDLVITDMTMPNMTGVELAKEILNIRSNIPIVICTGFSEQMSKDTTKAMGISGFVMKPVLMSEVAKKIREVLDKKE